MLNLVSKIRHFIPTIIKYETCRFLFKMLKHRQYGHFLHVASSKPVAKVIFKNAESGIQHKAFYSNNNKI